MLLDEKMLPGIKIRIPQMEDLLQAEQAYLGVVLEVAEWLRERMILLNEEVMNIPNLKAKIKQITGWDCEILEDAEHLTLTIRYYFEIISGKIHCYYNQIGVTREIDDHYCFGIVPGFKTPDWAKGAVMYQIFVDRFRNGGPV